MNENIDIIKMYMAGLGYSEKLMDASIEKNRDNTSYDANSVAQVANMLVGTTIEQLVADGYIFNTSLYYVYLNTITDKEKICTYHDFMVRFFVNINKELQDCGYSSEIIADALSGKEVTSLDEAKHLVAQHLARLEEVAETKRRQEELAKQKDYNDEVCDYLDSKHVSVVHPRDLADEFYNSLSTTEKEHYGGNPTYAVHCNLDDARLQDALSRCMEKFNHSKMVDLVIDEYITKNCSEEENKQLAIDKLAQLCPELLRSGDRRADAYQAIMREKAVNNVVTPDADMAVKVKQAAAKFAAKFTAGEPIRVAQDTCSDDVFVCAGVDRDIHKKVNSTTEEAIHEKQREDPEWAKELKSQVEEYKQQIANMQREIDLQNHAINSERVHREQQNYYRDPYYRERNKPQFPMWLIGVGANLVFIVIIALIGSLTGVSTLLGMIGLLISAIGYPMLGKVDEGKRFIIVGYGLFVIWLLWTVLL